MAVEHISDGKMKQVLADNISELMRRDGKSRKDLCNDLNIKYTTLCDWVNAKTYPRVESLVSLANYFDIEMADFFVEKSVSNMEGRLMAYAAKTIELDASIAEFLSDEQVKALLSRGFVFKTKTMDDVIKENEGKLNTGYVFDFGQPEGNEIW